MRRPGKAAIARLAAWLLAMSPALAESAAPPAAGSAKQLREQIQQGIAAHRDEVRACYEAHLEKQPEWEGKVTVKLTVTARGKVASAEVVEASGADAALTSCISGHARTWEFPKRTGGDVVVTYPFVLKAAHERPPRVDEGARLMSEAVTDEQIGFASVAGLKSSPLCRSRGCDSRKEVARLCSAFEEAERQIDAGAGYLAVVGPIRKETRAVCCDAVLTVLRSVGEVSDDDKYSLWCSLDPSASGTRCGWPVCPAFVSFWPKFRKHPASWFEGK